MNNFSQVKVGDKVFRRFGSEAVPAMELTITDVLDGLIACGDYGFETKNGLEVDPFLGWGENGSGSYITLK